VKPVKTPLGKGVNRVSSWLRNHLAATRGNVESNKIFNCLEVGSFNPFS
jgi:hypothetical protein